MREGRSPPPCAFFALNIILPRLRRDGAWRRNVVIAVLRYPSPETKYSCFTYLNITWGSTKMWSIKTLTCCLFPWNESFVTREWTRGWRTNYAHTRLAQCCVILDEVPWEATWLLQDNAFRKRVWTTPFSFNVPITRPFDPPPEAKCDQGRSNKDGLEDSLVFSQATKIIHNQTPSLHETTSMKLYSSGRPTHWAILDNIRSNLLLQFRSLSEAKL